ncbi:hypothetical protein PMIN01_12476 [Paraphaeosphaeria minitans]|uniref:Uncharacterized protein n=1 Tax=Paraphaeosphaeria minitans TaxID=565426 RepID=A0A9P6G678_9PLEO|nr:hypothetical protein PMIN01_12476 [Paraphaeosphaeria minitans]
MNFDIISDYHVKSPDAELDIPGSAETFETLSDPKRTNLVWRYALSKVLIHHCYQKLATSLRNSPTYDWSRVIANMINPAWCGTELPGAKPHALMEIVSMAVIGWTARE